MVSWMICLLLTAAIPGQSECTAVFFTSPRCEPCQQVAPALGQLQQEGWDVRTVNAPENPELAAQYRVDTLPTVVIVGTKTRREIDRIVGSVTHEQLDGRFRRAAARFSSVPLADSRPPEATVRGQSPVAPAPTAAGTTPAGGFPMLAGNFHNASPTAIEPHFDNARVPPQVASRVRDTASDSVALASHASPVNQPTKPALTIQQAIARAAAATVRIKVEEPQSTAYGTGTIIDVHDREALVLTCGHLFRDMEAGSRLSVDLFAGTPNEVSVTAQLIDFRAEDEDIGLISFVLPVPIDAVELLPRGQQLRVGEEAFSFGCDHGQPPTRRDTTIRHINRFLGAANVEIAGAPVVGRSGGGLFDVQGRLIGVCNGADPESDEGVYAAADVIYAQINRLGLDHLFDSSAMSGMAKAQPGSMQSVSGTVQLASSAQPAVDAAGFNENSTAVDTAAIDDSLWPAPTSVSAAALSSQPTAPSAATQLMSASSTPSGEVICIVRTPSGESRVVTISQPSPELLRAIEEAQR